MFIARRKASLILLLTGVLIVGEVAIVGFLSAVQPVFVRATYKVNTIAEEHAFSLPLVIPSSVDAVDIRMEMHLPFLHPNRFYLHPDDCVENLIVNGHSVRSSDLPFCDYIQGRTVDLSSFLQSGKNDLQIGVKNSGGPTGFNIWPAFSDPMFSIPSLLGILLFIVYGLILIFFYIDKKSGARPLAWIVMAGIVLRMLYNYYTPYHIRAYDWDGHMDYIFYVAQHWRIPSAIAGWEFHQPPLYYFLSAAEITISHTLQQPFYFLLKELQLTSLLISIITFVVGVWIANSLFPTRRDVTKRYLFTGMLATLPSIVFFSSRINNDILYALFGFLFVALLIKWWKEKMNNDWYWLSLVLALGLLSKNNAAAFVPVAWICLWCCRSLSRRSKVRLFAASVGIITVVFGWLPVLRFLIERETRTSYVGNMSDLNGVFFMGNIVKHLTTFSPLRILQFPYNNTFSDIPQGRFFWEFFYRSTVTGEFNLGDHVLWCSRAALFFGLLLLPLVCFGLWKALSKHAYKTLPLWLTLFGILAAHIALRISVPSSTFQDFRYSLVMILPLSFFLLRGMESRYRAVRIYGYTALIAFLCSSFGVLLLLIFEAQQFSS